MSCLELNNPAISTMLSPIFLNCGVLGTLTVGGVPVGGGAGHMLLPNGAFSTSGSVAINNTTGTLVVSSAPIASLFFTGKQLVIDLQGYIQPAVPLMTCDVIDVYATYSKNGGAPVALTAGGQISNACYNGCSCRVYGTTTDTFSSSDTITINVYAKTQVNASLNVGITDTTWNGLFANL